MILFTTADGKNRIVTFLLVCGIFCLSGLCNGMIAVGAGFTFLETVANPYTTVLGHPDYASSRINLAQSFNAIGWILGPLLGGKFTLAAAGAATNDRLYVPYLVVAVMAGH